MSNLAFGLIFFAVALPSIVFHEVAHGYMAFLLGDRTAKDMGRLSLDPLKHVDPIGTLLVPAVLALLRVLGSPVPVFGWAKPVPINPRYFRNFRWGLLLTGIAGPLANLVMASVAGLIIRILPIQPGLNLSFSGVIMYMLVMFVFVNMMLMFFNLIPIPPFDGSRIIPVFLSDAGLRIYAQAERFGLLLIVLLLWFGGNIIQTYFTYTVIPVTAFLVGPQWAAKLLGG